MSQLLHVPSVCVVIPSYNHARFLPEAVASVVAQTFNDWEIIIVNNGSPDDTSAVAHRLIARFHNMPIRLIEHTARGPGAGRNAAVALTRAPYVLALDADDMIDARFLERTVPVLIARPEVGFVSVDTRFFGVEQGSWSGGEPSVERMIYDSRTTVTALFRRKAWEQVGGFSEQPGYEDWDFWLRLIECGWVGTRVPETLFWYRRRAGSNQMRNQRSDMRFRAQIVADHAGLYPHDFQAWAGMVMAHSSLIYMPLYFLWYAALVARHAPHELPKTLLRPMFKLLGPRAQMYARRAARLIKMNQTT